MGWLVLAPSALAAVLWLFAPGLLAVLAARQRGFAALALAPAASAGIIAVAAIGASWLGVPWGPWPVAVLAVLTALAVAGLNGGLRLAAGRHRGPTAPKPLSRPRLSGWPKAARAAWIRSERPYFWLGAAGAAALLTRHLRNILDRPDAFSQTYDNIFHMNAVRWILDTQDGSSLTLTAMTSGNQPPEFYPAAWHDFVSLVALTTGDPLLAHACNAVIWAVMALAWPLGGLFLVQTLLRRLTPAGVLGAAVLTASFGAFPTLLVGFGVLYPNFLGFALLPAVLALTCQSLGLSAGRRPPTPLGLVLLAVALTGLALAHPNAALSYAAILVPLGLRWAWQGWRLRSAGRWRRPAGLVLGLAAAAVLWVKIRPPYWASLRWPPVESSEAALGEALLAGPLRIQGSWLLGVLIAGGLIAALRRRRRWLAWSAGAWAICCLLWSAAAAWPQDGLRFWFVGGYYSDPYRLAALLAIPSLPLAAVGLEYALRWLNAGLRRRGLGQPVWAAAALAVAVAAALTAGTQATAGMNAAIDVVSDDYQINADSPLVDSDEYRLIERLPELVPAGVRVAVNPWNGSSMAYALVGVLTTTTHVAYEASPAEAVIDNRLSQVGSDPAGVCPAVRERGVGYALDFGSKEVHGGENPLPGLENLATAPGFEEVAREGHAVLYKVTACS